MRVYVGNLPFKTTEQDLSDLFSQVGEVSSVTIVTDRMTGRSRGFGFVEMSDEDGAQAVEKLNGYEMEGRNLKVNEARPRVDRGQFNGGNRRRW